MAETIPTKSEILKQSRDCIKDFRTQACKELVSEIEKLQIVEFDQNRFKCQTSLLGLQSEVIKAYFLFKSFKSVVYYSSNKVEFKTNYKFICINLVNE